jgi:hypothetical protein
VQSTNILVYVKDPRRYYFDADAAERIPYMAPGLVGPEKAARGTTGVAAYEAERSCWSTRAQPQPRSWLAASRAAVASSSSAVSA